MHKFRVLALAVTLSIGIAGVAHADLMFSGSGTFGSSAPTTPESAPGATMSFSFNLPNPISTNPTNQATNFAYDLNGAPVSVSLGSVLFFPSSQGGLFDLNFSDGNVLNLLGADTGGSTLTISTLTSSAEIGVNGSQSAVGSGTVDITNVPEPASLTLLATSLAGFAGFGLLRRRKRA